VKGNLYDGKAGNSGFAFYDSFHGPGNIRVSGTTTDHISGA